MRLPENTCFFYTAVRRRCLHRCSTVCLLLRRIRTRIYMARRYFTTILALVGTHGQYLCNTVGSLGWEKERRAALSRAPTLLSDKGEFCLWRQLDYVLGILVLHHRIGMLFFLFFFFLFPVAKVLRLNERARLTRILIDRRRINYFQVFFSLSLSLSTRRSIKKRTRVYIRVCVYVS